MTAISAHRMGRQAPQQRSVPVRAAHRHCTGASMQRPSHDPSAKAAQYRHAKLNGGAPGAIRRLLCRSIQSELWLLRL